MKLVTARTMQDLDRYTIETLGIPGIVLMEVAGRACADHTAEILTEVELDTALVMCGPGNNGGDGFVVARHLSDWGFDVIVALFCKPDSIKGDALINFNAMKRFPVAVIDVEGELSEDVFDEAARNGVIVDALFGTGLERPVEGRYAEAIDTANGLPCPRIAVDIPSGICSDTGRILGTAFNADMTVTFGSAKIGHFSHPGRACCGVVEVAEIGIPGAAIHDAPGAALLDPSFAAGAFEQRGPGSFKNNYGHLLVIGGLGGKGGAALLAAMASIRSGAGLASIATDSDAQAHLEGRFPEVMVEGPFSITGDGLTIDEKSFAGSLEGKTAIAIGPGLSTLPGAGHLLDLALDAGLPTVLDADALNLIASDPDRDWGLGPDCVLTPHPGEAGRLLGRSAGEVQNARVQSAIDLADRFGSIVILKGAGTLITAPDARLGVNPTGGPALATAGSGDVLTGIVGALLARELPAWEAACSAVFVHGVAGDIAGETMSDHCVGASDLLDMLPKAIKSTVDQ